MTISLQMNLHLDLRYHLFLFIQRNLNGSTKTILFHNPNKMDKYIKIQKDICPYTSKSNVVYRFRVIIVMHHTLDRPADN